MGADRTFVSTLTGSFSSPAAGNPTVVMVEAAYVHHGVAARYINCEVTAEALGDAVRGARAMGWAGFNLSLPHKTTVISQLDGLAPSAQIIGAVNCAVRRGGDLIGENTDGQGFLAALRTVTDPAGRQVVLLGAGGAARAIAVEIALAGAASITVVNRGQRRGEELAELIRDRTPAAAHFVPWDGTYPVPAAAEVVVNATSIGLFPEVSGRVLADLSAVGPGTVVADVIPNPPRTAFLADAADRGCVTLDGLGMLVNQAVICIGLWTGVAADPAIMRRALDGIFGG